MTQNEKSLLYQYLINQMSIRELAITKFGDNRFRKHDEVDYLQQICDVTEYKLLKQIWQDFHNLGIMGKK